MDWLPPGGLERVFAQYDRIVAHHHTDPPPHVAEPPPTAPPVAKPVSSDEPPWQSPHNDLFDRMEAGEQRLFGKRAPRGGWSLRPYGRRGTEAEGTHRPPFGGDL